MNNNGQLDFLDLISIASFVIALMNLDENMNQGDKQDLQHDLADKADMLLSQIHTHLENQDIKLDHILKRLEAIENDDKRNLCKDSGADDKWTDAS